MKIRKLPAKKIKQFLEELFLKAGVSKKLHLSVVSGLIFSSLRGVDSHGIRLAPHYIEAALRGRINKHPKISFTESARSVAIMDADHAYGITAGTLAMQKAITLARKNGIGAVAVKNSSHFGAAAIYSLQAANENMIGISFTHAEARVVPYGGRRPFLGTNPICFAAPCAGEEPFCLDMATTNISWNALRMYKESGKKLDPFWAVDKEGVMTCDPREAAALLPIGRYKGYGLGLMIEICSSLLTGMPFGPNVQNIFPVDGKKRYLGHFFIAIDIAKFQPINVFKKRLRELMNELRKRRAARGFTKVLVPGDPEKIMFRERSRSGIPVPEELLKELNNLKRKLG